MRPRPPRLRPQWPTTTPILPCRIPRAQLPLLSTQLSHRPMQQTRTIRSIDGPRPRRSRFNHNPNHPPLTSTPAAAYERKVIANTLPLRSGVIATKKGMTAIYDPETGKRRPGTVLQMDRVQVVANKTRAKHGYFAVCVGEGTRQPRNVGRAMMGVFAKSVVGGIVNGTTGKKNTNSREHDEGKAVLDEMVDEPATGIPVKRQIREFKVRDEKALLPIGTALTPGWFRVGQFVDTRSHTRGFGFAGVMKRWGMKGQPASHGVSLTHRSIGSVGGGQGSGSRIHPGKKMAGRMGNKRHTIHNLEVLMVDNENGIVVVSGPVSGHKGCLVMLQDALRKPWPDVSTWDTGVGAEDSQAKQEA